MQRIVIIPSRNILNKVRAINERCFAVVWQDTRGVVHAVPPAFGAPRDGQDGSVAASSDRGNTGEERVVQWQLTPQLGAGQKLLLAIMANSLNALLAEVKPITASPWAYGASTRPYCIS